MPNIFTTTQAIALSDEPYLEKWARIFRFNTSLPVISAALAARKKITLIDIGCGQDVNFFKFLEIHFPDRIKDIEYIGLDPLIEADEINANLPKNCTILTTPFEKLIKSKKLPQADIVSMFAVLEHVDDDVELLGFALTLMKKTGTLVATTPSFLAQTVLEFLSFQLGLISRREIEEHKRYFSKKTVEAAYAALPKKLKTDRQLKHRYFEIGLNNEILISPINS